MNDRFKFRVWYFHQKKFVYNQTFQDIGVYSFPLDWCVLQQNSGIKDSVGQDIYEGDILECPFREVNKNVIVQYSEEAAAFVFIDGSNRIYFQEFLKFNIVKVIGNIYQPHL